MAAFTDTDVERLVQDAGIVRHRGKIVSVINNARRAQDLRREAGSLAAFIWRFEPAPASKALTAGAIVAKTTESTALSKALRQRGWSFVGPTTVYAFMQSMGLVNDHLDGCCVRDAVEAERAAFTRPR